MVAVAEGGQEGLRRVLYMHPERRALSAVEAALPLAARAWDLTVASDMGSAVRALDGRRFDVVISSRDDAPTGRAFLDVVRSRWPQLARVRLCGLTAPQPAGVRSVTPAGLPAVRPSLTQALVTALNRAFALPELLDRPRLAGLWAEMRQRPTVSARLTSLEQFHRLLGGGASSPIASEVLGFSLARLEQQALLSARIARRLLPGPSAEHAFLAALLTTVGRAALALAFPAAFAEALASRAEADDLAAERRVFGVSHAEVGAWLLARWGLPRGIVEAVAFHRQPGLLHPGGFQVLLAVHVATVLTEQIVNGGRGPGRGPALDVELIGQLGLARQVPVWLRVADQEANLPQSVQRAPITGRS